MLCWKLMSFFKARLTLVPRLKDKTITSTIVGKLSRYELKSFNVIIYNNDHKMKVIKLWLIAVYKEPGGQIINLPQNILHF